LRTESEGWRKPGLSLSMGNRGASPSFASFATFPTPRSSPSTAYRWPVRPPRAGRPSAEQPGGKFAPADPPARAQAAEVQEPGISPAFLLDLRRGLQHLQPPAPPDLPRRTPDPPSRSPRGVGQRDHSGVLTGRSCRTRSIRAR
jgi:hypothetical protein